MSKTSSISLKSSDVNAMSTSGLHIEFNHASVFDESGHAAKLMQNQGIGLFTALNQFLSHKIGSRVIRPLQ